MHSDEIEHVRKIHHLKGGGYLATAIAELAVELVENNHVENNQTTPVQCEHKLELVTL